MQEGLTKLVSMETQTFLYSRARGCQLHHYTEVFYADSDIFLCIGCAQNKLELAGVGYPNLFPYCHMDRWLELGGGPMLS